MAITPIEGRCRQCRHELLLGDLRDLPGGLCPSCGYPLAPDWWDYAVGQASLADTYLQRLVGVLRHLVQLPGNLELEPHSVLRNLVEEVGWEEQLAAEPDTLEREIDFLRQELERWSGLAPRDRREATPAVTGGLRRLAGRLRALAGTEESRTPDGPGDARERDRVAGQIRAAATTLEDAARDVDAGVADPSQVAERVAEAETSVKDAGLGETGRSVKDAGLGGTGRSR
jgi:hypothetical protein